MADILKERFLVTRRGCKGCLEYYRFMPMLNLCFPLGKEIRLMDNFEYEELMMERLLKLNRFDPDDLKTYPLAYLDGILYIGAEWAEQLKIMVVNHCKQDFIIQPSIEFSS